MQSPISQNVVNSLRQSGDVFLQEIPGVPHRGDLNNVPPGLDIYNSEEVKKYVESILKPIVEPAPTLHEELKKRATRASAELDSVVQERKWLEDNVRQVEKLNSNLINEGEFSRLRSETLHNQLQEARRNLCEDVNIAFDNEIQMRQEVESLTAIHSQLLAAKSERDKRRRERRFRRMQANA